MLEKPKILNEDMIITYRSIKVQVKKIDPFGRVALVYIPPLDSERWIPTNELIIENALLISPN